MITIIHGTDRLAIDERLASLRREIDPTSFSTTVIEDAARNIPEVKAACGALGFFGGGRLILAHQLLFASAKRRKRTKGADEQESGVEALRSIPHETTLVIIENVLDAATEREARRVAQELVVERFDVPRGQRLVEWTSARARYHHAILGQSESRQLLEALFPGSWQAVARRDDIAPDLYRLDSELAKLAVAAGDQQTILAAHVTSLVPGAEAEDFWGITNAILQSDPARALIEVERAYLQGSAPEGILGQIISQFEVLAVLSLAGKSIGIAELAASSGLSEGRLRQSGRYIGGFSPSRITSALDEIRELDKGAKLGLVDLTDSLIPLVAALATS